MSTNDRNAARRTKLSLAVEAAALAYAEAVAVYRAEYDAVTADHLAATGSIMGSMTTRESEDRLRPLMTAKVRAEDALDRAAVALWKAERLRGAGRVKP